MSLRTVVGAVARVVGLPVLVLGSVQRVALRVLGEVAAEALAGDGAVLALLAELALGDLGLLRVVAGHVVVVVVLVVVVVVLVLVVVVVVRLVVLLLVVVVLLLLLVVVLLLAVLVVLLVLGLVGVDAKEAFDGLDVDAGLSWSVGGDVDEWVL